MNLFDFLKNIEIKDESIVFKYLKTILTKLLKKVANLIRSTKRLLNIKIKI